MKALNPRQREAVRYLDGPLLVLAGAGSGKTAVITQKIAWLIREAGLTPEQIAAVTFTNKAAREMKERVGKLLSGREGKGLTISTFHTLGLRILRGEAARLGYRPGFSIHDGEDAQSVVREILHGAKGVDFSQVYYQISRWKNALLAPEEVVPESGNAVAQHAARVYPEYQRHLRACNALDFDDLIFLPIRLLREHADVREAWQNQLRYLLVDEYQDTNACQYELVRLLAGVRRAFTVVGDDDQSIYAWRGAQPENLRQLATDYPELKVIKLEQNYRSSGRILKAANTLIGNNPHIFEKRLWSEHGYGLPLRVLAARDEEDEADRVVAELMHHKFLNRTNYGDYAILYRGNHQSRPFEKILRERRIPYHLSGGTSFFDRGEVRDILAYCRLIANPDDDAAFLRIANTPRREIGATTLERLGNYARDRGTSLVAASSEVGLAQFLNDRALATLRRFTHWVRDLADRAADSNTDVTALLKELLTDLRYDLWLRDTCDSPQAAERRYENVTEVTDWLARLAKHPEEPCSFQEAVAKLTLVGMLEDDKESENDQVTLMTLHAAKGLEFPHVTIVGMEEGLLPHRTSLDEATDPAQALEEERRLAYVGITRARDSLTFTWAKGRKRYGEVIAGEPSRFLSELPADDLQWEGRDTVSTEEKQASGRAALTGLRDLLGKA